MNTDDRINSILHNRDFNEYLRKNSEAEEGRQFCIHDINHFLDVARVSYIIVLERNLDYPKDIIYAAALLHDIGRWLQYEQNIPHEKASADLAKQILEQSDYDTAEVDLICNAIVNHRGRDKKDGLNEILSTSDKLSRKCFTCPSVKECNWSEDRKNNNITY